MTEAVLALVPTYGIWILAGCLLLSCLALPLPSSILVMTAGGFASTGDLVLWQVQAMALLGFVLGDQLAYAIARSGARLVIERLRRHSKFQRLFARAGNLLDRHGLLAIILSRTIVSPLGPYISYLSGLTGVSWPAFTLAAVFGAVCWCAGYSLLGYLFATQIAAIASTIGNAVGLMLVLCAAIALLIYLWRVWKVEWGTSPNTRDSEGRRPPP